VEIHGQDAKEKVSTSAVLALNQMERARDSLGSALKPANRMSSGAMD
jgi:hypothetical protein